MNTAALEQHAACQAFGAQYMTVKICGEAGTWPSACVWEAAAPVPVHARSEVVPEGVDAALTWPTPVQLAQAHVAAATLPRHRGTTTGVGTTSRAPKHRTTTNGLAGIAASRVGQGRTWPRSDVQQLRRGAAPSPDMPGRDWPWHMMASDTLTLQLQVPSQPLRASSDVGLPELEDAGAPLPVWPSAESMLLQASCDFMLSPASSDQLPASDEVGSETHPDIAASQRHDAWADLLPSLDVTRLMASPTTGGQLDASASTAAQSAALAGWGSLGLGSPLWQ